MALNKGSFEAKIEKDLDKVFAAHGKVLRHEMIKRVKAENAENKRNNTGFKIHDFTEGMGTSFYSVEYKGDREIVHEGDMDRDLIHWDKLDYDVDDSGLSLRDLYPSTFAFIDEYDDIFNGVGDSRHLIGDIRF